MRVAVTGARGFLGGLLVDALRRAGHTPVVLVRSAVSTDEADVVPLDGGLPAAAARAEADVVVLLGARFLATPGPGDVGALVASNVMGAVSVAQAFLDAGSRGVVLAGSAWEANDDGSPPTPYGASRTAAWGLVDTLARWHGAGAVALRVADTYGPGDERGRLFAGLRGAVRSGEPLAMSPGHQWLDPALGSDVAAAFAGAVTAAVAGASGVWGVSGGSPRTLREVVDAYASVVGREVPVAWGARPYRRGEPLAPRYLPAPPWWSPSVTLVEGIGRMEAGPGGLLAEAGSTPSTRSA